MAGVYPLGRSSYTVSETPDTSFVLNANTPGLIDMSPDGKYLVYVYSNRAYPCVSADDGGFAGPWMVGSDARLYLSEPSIKGIAVKDDFTAIVACGSTNKYVVFQYGLVPTNFNQGTRVTSSVSAQITTPAGIAVSPDGTHIYVGDLTGPTIYQYGATNAWAGNAGFAYASKSLDISAKVTTPTNLSISDDGTEIYVSDKTAGNLYQYHMSTAWDITTASWVHTLSLGANRSGVMVADTIGADVSPGDLVGVYRFGTAKDISSAESGKRAVHLSEATTSQSLFVDPTDTHLYVGGSGVVYHYTFDVPGDITGGLTYDGAVSTASGTVNGIGMKPDGTRMWTSNNNLKVRETDFSPAWYVAGASYHFEETVSEYMYGVAASDDGTLLYYADWTNGLVKVSTMSTPWLLSSHGTWGTVYTTGKMDGFSFTSDGAHGVVHVGDVIYDYMQSSGTFPPDGGGMLKNTVSDEIVATTLGPGAKVVVSGDGAYYYALNSTGTVTQATTEVGAAATGGAGWGMLPVGA